MNEQIGASPELASGKANLGHALETCVMLELERRGAVDIPAEIALNAAWNCGCARGRQMSEKVDPNDLFHATI